MNKGVVEMYVTMEKVRYGKEKIKESMKNDKRNK
jgi:hypothetical protein